MMINAIAISCFRTTANYASCSSANLATAITAAHSLKPLSLLQLIQQVSAAGGDAREFRALWQYQEYVRRAEEDLRVGNLAAVQTLLLVCPVEFSAKTQAALQGVIAANTLRLVDVVAAELGQAAPAKVTSADVNAALSRP
jgi:hypothetical protein